MQFLSFFLLLSLAFGALIGPLTPKEDPFYKVPDGLEDIPEGTVLRQRPAPAAIRSVLLPMQVDQATQYLVRLTDQLGKPTAIVTTLLKPHNANPNKLVSYHIFTDSLAPNCAPSYSILFGAQAQTIVSQIEMLFVQMLLNKGYFVVLPDHQGPLAGFAQGKMAAHAVLDSIRAVLKADNGLSANARVVEWGYSGGSVPTLFAAAAQPSYAPDLKGKLVGATAGGIVTDLDSVARYIDGGLFSGFLVQALAGLQAVYPGLTEIIQGQVSPQHYKFFLQAYNFCLAPSAVIWTLQNFFTGPFRWAKDGWDVFNLPVVRKILNECLLGGTENPGVPEVPVMIYHGKPDEIIPFGANAERIYDIWCEKNIGSLEFNVDLTGFHVSSILTGLPAAYKFIDERLDGVEPRTKGCKRTDRLNNLLIPGSDPTLFPLVVTTLTSWFGADLGPKILDNGGNLMSALAPKLAEEGGVPDAQSVPGYMAPEAQRIEDIPKLQSETMSALTTTDSTTTEPTTPATEDSKTIQQTTTVSATEQSKATQPPTTQQPQTTESASAQSLGGFFSSIWNWGKSLFGF